MSYIFVIDFNNGKSKGQGKSVPLHTVQTREEWWYISTNS